MDFELWTRKFFCKWRCWRLYYLQKSGKGRIAGSVSAKYKIKSGVILTKIEAETKRLFNRIVNRETVKPIEIIKN